MMVDWFLKESYADQFPDRSKYDTILEFFGLFFYNQNC